jgi:hypothetical protein
MLVKIDFSKVRLKSLTVDEMNYVIGYEVPFQEFHYGPKFDKGWKALTDKYILEVQYNEDAPNGAEVTVKEVEPPYVEVKAQFTVEFAGETYPTKGD